MERWLTINCRKKINGRAVFSHIIIHTVILSDMQSCISHTFSIIAYILRSDDAKLDTIFRPSSPSSLRFYHIQQLALSSSLRSSIIIIITSERATSNNNNIITQPGSSSSSTSTSALYRRHHHGRCVRNEEGGGRARNSVKKTFLISTYTYTYVAYRPYHHQQLDRRVQSANSYTQL